MKSIFPPALKPGDKIGIIAPSSVYDVSRLQPAVDFLTSHGFDVIFHPQTAATHQQFAGTPTEKVAALHDYFLDPDIKAIFCTCGGNGAIHLLDKINYNLIAQNPKIFIGLSDITVLLNAISAKTGIVTFHGPTLTRITAIEPVWTKQMLGVLTGQIDSFELNDCTPLSNSEIKGTLFGGNLSVLQTLIGTPYAPPLENSILLLEDTNDHLSRYDRMLGHMKQAGWFKNLSAIMLGEFLKSQDNTARPFGFTLKDMLDMHAPDIPLLTNIPVGHGEKLCTLPIGAKVTLKKKEICFKPLL